MSEKKLVNKLVEVMKKVKYIPKTGENTFHNYKYATEADVNERVRDALSEQGVVMIPNVKSHSYREHINAKGKTEYIVTVEVEFSFIDGETGEIISFTTYGEGQDAGDKGTYKAITGAQKYALMKSLLIPTGDDPEADGGVDERNNSNENRKDSPPEKPSAALKAKYQLLKGSLDGFEDYVDKMVSKGRTHQQIERILQDAIMKNEQKGA